MEKLPVTGSKKFSLNLVDLKKIGIGLLIAVIGAGLTYLTEMIPNVDFGSFSPLVVSAWSVVVNVVRKFLTNYAV